jgi:hypothetical protein
MKYIANIEQWPTEPTGCIIEEEVLDAVPAVGAVSFATTTHIEHTYTKTWREGQLVMVEHPGSGMVHAFQLRRCPVVELDGERIMIFAS